MGDELGPDSTYPHLGFPNASRINRSLTFLLVLVSLYPPLTAMSPAHERELDDRLRGSFIIFDAVHGGPAQGHHRRALPASDGTPLRWIFEPKGLAAVEGISVLLGWLAEGVETIRFRNWQIHLDGQLILRVDGTSVEP